MLIRSVCVVLGFALAMAGCAGGGGSSDGSGNGEGGSSFDPADAPKSISWDAPTTYADGSPLVDLDKYRLYYGPTASQMQPVIEFPNVGSSYTFTSTDVQTIANLMSGNNSHIFALTAVDGGGIESQLSAPVVFNIS